MIRTMHDSTTAADIPLGARVVAGYVGGLYHWEAGDWARFPGATQVRIAVALALDGHVLDVENGDATPDQAPGWIIRQRAAGWDRPTIYCQRSGVMAEVIARCEGAGLHLGVHWTLWVADWTGEAHPIPGASVVQYAAPPRSGGHFDLSVIYDDAWPPKKGPPVPPTPPPAQRGASPTLVPESIRTCWSPDSAQFDIVGIAAEGPLAGHTLHIYYMRGVGWYGPEDLTLAG